MVRGFDGFDIQNGIGCTRDIAEQTKLKILYNIWLELREINNRLKKG